MLKDKEYPVYGDNGVKGTLISAARFLDPSPEKRIRLEDGREILVPSNALSAQPDGSYYLRTGAPDQSAGPAATEANSPPALPRREAESPKATDAPQTDPSVATHHREADSVPVPNLRDPGPSFASRPLHAEGLEDGSPDHGAPQLTQPAVQADRPGALTGQAIPAARADLPRASPSEPRHVLSAEAAGPLFREDCEVERVPVKRMLDQPAEIRQEGDTMIIPLMEEVLVVEKRLMLREELHIRRRREHKADGDRVPIPVDKLPR